MPFLVSPLGGVVIADSTHHIRMFGYHLTIKVLEEVQNEFDSTTIEIPECVSHHHDGPVDRALSVGLGGHGPD